LTRRLEETDAEELTAVVSTKGLVLVEGHEVGRIEGFTFHPDPATQGQEKKLVQRAARRALAAEMPRRILAAETATDEQLVLEDDRTISWLGAKIARLKRTENQLKPAVEILHSEFLDGLAREQIRTRLSAYVAGQVQARLGPLLAAMANPPAELRGIMHRLGEGTGVLPPESVSHEQRLGLKKLGVEAGRFALFMPAVLKPGGARLRALLWGVSHDRNPPPLPAPGLVSAPMPGNWGPDFALEMGWLPAEGLLIRLDIVERLVKELHYLLRKHPILLPPNLGSRMGLKPEQLAPVMHQLGFRMMPAGEPHPRKYGPPAPAMLGRRKMEPRAAPEPVAAPVAISEDNPFAALAALRRAAR
jgi:ATP-dependent RNA helicase SUPV3L1/SUV3